jgi:hypothetical protein
MARPCAVPRRVDLAETPGEYGLHPQLGEAIMATFAMAVAVEQDMHVVTPSRRVHDVLATRAPELIYDVMVRGDRAEPPSPSELIDDLASLVVIGAFKSRRSSRPRS